MPTCGYVVLPLPGARDESVEALSRMGGCEVFPAEDQDLLLLVTHTESFEADIELRCRVQAERSVQALLMTFGEIDPDTLLADPVREGRRTREGDPVRERRR